MPIPTAVTPTPRSARDRLAPRVPCCHATQLTKPECHCPACLFEQVAAHATAAARATPRAAGAEAPGPSRVIL